MVFTCPVRTDTSVPPPATGRLTRRAALAGLGGVGVLIAVAGCTGHSPVAAPSAKAIGSDPLGPLYTETIALISTYDQAMVATPALVPLAGQLREEHRQHAVALAALIGIAAPSISPGPAPSGAVPPTPGATPAHPVPSASPAAQTGAARAALSTAEKTAQRNAVAACLSAPAGRVAVLASIAACRATHVAALR